MSNIKLLEEKKISFLLEIIDLIKEYNEEFVETYKGNITRELVSFNELYKTFINELPKNIKRTVSTKGLQKQKQDNFWVKSLKFGLRFMYMSGLTPLIALFTKY